MYWLYFILLRQFLFIDQDKNYILVLLIADLMYDLSILKFVIQIEVPILESFNFLFPKFFIIFLKK